GAPRAGAVPRGPARRHGRADRPPGAGRGGLRRGADGGGGQGRLSAAGRGAGGVGRGRGGAVIGTGRELRGRGGDHASAAVGARRDQHRGEQKTRSGQASPGLIVVSPPAWTDALWRE